MKKITTLLALASTLALAPLTQAAVFVTWDFTGNNPNDHAQNATAVGQIIAAESDYATTLAGVTSSSLIGAGDLVFSNGLAAGIPLNENEINLQAKGGTGQWKMDFILSANSEMIDITGISMNLWRNGGGAPDTMAWQVSTDGGANFAGFGSTSPEANTADGIFRPHTFTDSVEASSIVLRFNPTGGTGNLHISDITVSGTLVPEPGSAALLGLGGLALFARRRRG